MKKPTKQKQQTRQSRRKFIKNAGLASAAFTIVPRFAIGGKGFIPPSDTLYLAGIGVGGKGRSDLSECAKSPNVKVVHLCDVDDRQAVRSKENFPDAKYHKDFRKMLEKEGKSIDAVTVSTPDHTHAIAALTAMQMGKHVYVQKPLTWSITEARMLAQAAEKYKVVTQMGNQGGSGDGVRKMKEIVDAGLIGEVTKVQSWTNRPIWPQGIEKSTEKTPIPDGLDWDLWLGPAEFTEFQNVYAPFGWRGWFAFGTGALGDMACHILDPAFRILPIDYPSEVECSVVSKWDNSFKEIYLPDSFPSASALYFKFPVKNSDSHIELTWMDGGVKPERPAELGADAIFKAGDQWTFHAGPRLNFGSSKFTNTYFGVTAAEASALYPATTASGGLYSAGLEAGVRFQVDDNWAVEADAGWSRLTGDAARSPITAQGSKNQYSASFGVVRRFDIGF